jgi:hypothetical protein
LNIYGDTVLSGGSAISVRNKRHRLCLLQEGLLWFLTGGGGAEFLVVGLAFIFVSSCFDVGISEQRIEQAKKIQRIQEYRKNPTLIPIQRLPIPSKPVTSTQREQQPLVDWDTDERYMCFIIERIS